MVGPAPKEGIQTQSHNPYYHVGSQAPAGHGRLRMPRLLQLCQSQLPIEECCFGNSRWPRPGIFKWEFDALSTARIIPFSSIWGRESRNRLPKGDVGRTEDQRVSR